MFFSLCFLPSNRENSLAKVEDYFNSTQNRESAEESKGATNQGETGDKVCLGGFYYSVKGSSGEVNLNCLEMLLYNILVGNRYVLTPAL